MKHCTKCGEDKDVSLFYKRSRAKDGYNPHCKSCVQQYEREYRTPELQRKYNLKKSFSLTVERYNAMYTEQNGLCAICHLPETTVRQGKVQHLSVDHCHTTGKIRGLLCNSCNRALGKFKDDVVLLSNAVSYLEKYSD